LFSLRFGIRCLLHVERETNSFHRNLRTNSEQNVASTQDGLRTILRLAWTEVLGASHVAELAPHLRGGHTRVGMKVGAEREDETLLEQHLLDRLVVPTGDCGVYHFGEADHSLVVEHRVATFGRLHHWRGHHRVGLHRLTTRRRCEFRSRWHHYRGVASRRHETFEYEVTAGSGDGGVTQAGEEHDLRLRHCRVREDVFAGLLEPRRCQGWVRERLSL